jgi:hypothetical protein
VISEEFVASIKAILPEEGRRIELIDLAESVTHDSVRAVMDPNFSMSIDVNEASVRERVEELERAVAPTFVLVVSWRTLRGQGLPPFALAKNP